MTSPQTPSLLFDDPGDLLAAIPGMLGFVPAESLVLVTYTGRLRLHLESVVRLDLPDPAHYPDIGEQLRVVAGNHAATVVELVVLRDTPAIPPALPHRALIERLVETFAADGIHTAHAVWSTRIAEGAPWWCYQDEDCAGEIADPASSPVAAVMAAAGIPTRPTREALAAHLAPDPPDALARRGQLLAALPPPDPEQAFPYVRAAVDTLSPPDAPAGCAAPDRPGALDLDDDTIVRLAHALSHSDVRQSCLAFALTPRACPAERLWLALTRGVPPPARAAPASLLAVCAYLRGKGALATLALDAALAADPGHGLANTVRGVLDYGVPPDRFRLMLAESFVHAFTAT